MPHPPGPLGHSVHFSLDIWMWLELAAAKD